MMYLTCHSLVLIVALFFSDAFAIALGGQKFTVQPDKRQAQDLVRRRLLNLLPQPSDDSTGNLGRTFSVRTRRAYLPLHWRVPSLASSCS
jgi:hypothetical protein